MISRLNALEVLPEGIRSIDSLRQHLQVAIELELSTIPPYLCALYSIKPGSNREAASLVTSVVMEEMLHLTLASNLLNAIGGAPDLTSQEVVPRYPTALPDSNGAFQVNLMKFSREAIATFLRIEFPAPRKSKPEDSRYHTIGQFYAAISNGLKEVCKDKSDFEHRRECQAKPSDFYNGHGGVIVVENLETALAAITTIVDQGEGYDHGICEHSPEGAEGKDLAHYFRFNEIMEGQRYRQGDTPVGGPTGAMLPVNWDAVSNMVTNPTVEWFTAGDPRRVQMENCNATFFELLRALQDGFNGQKKRLELAIPLMLELRERATALMSIPSGIAGTMLGPSFECKKQ